MKLVPLGDKIVLRQLEAEETTKSGIVLPGQAKEKPQEAEVIAVGPGGNIDGKEVVMQVKTGDKVAVFNDRGRVELPVHVTPRIIPGVVAFPQGGWFTPDAKGTDKGPSINTLTSLKKSPLAKANPQHTNLVEVKKI